MFDNKVNKWQYLQIPMIFTTNFFKIWAESVWYLRQISFIFAPNLFYICTKSLLYLHQISFIFICDKFLWYFPQIFFEIAPNLFDICVKSLSYLHRISFHICDKSLWYLRAVLHCKATSLETKVSGLYQLCNPTNIGGNDKGKRNLNSNPFHCIFVNIREFSC